MSSRCWLNRSLADLLRCLEGSWKGDGAGKRERLVVVGFGSRAGLFVAGVSMRWPGCVCGLDCGGGGWLMLGDAACSSSQPPCRAAN